MATDVADLQATVTANTQGAVGPIQELVAMLGEAGPLAVGFAAAGAAIVGLGAVSVKMAGDFQAGMTTLVTGAGEAQQNMGLVSQGILKMAVDTGTSTQQLTDGMFSIESAGYHGADGLNVLQTAAEGAKVGNADLGTVADALTTIMTDYHLKASDASDAMNALTATVSSGKMHLQDLAGAMGTVLPIASSLHVSFPEVAGAIATMTNAGMDAQLSSQLLAHVMVAASAPTAGMSKALGDVGLSATQLSDTLTHQGLQAALQMVLTAIGNKYPAGSEAFNEASKAILGGIVGVKVAAELGGASMAGYTQRVKDIAAAFNGGKSSVTGWSDVQGDFNTQMDRAKELVQVFMIQLGTRLLPVLTQIAANLIGLAIPAMEAFGTALNFLQTHGDQVKVALLALAAGLGGALIPVIGTVVAAFGAWAISAGAAAVATIAAAAPFILIGLAIGAAVVGIVALVNHFGGLNAILAAAQPVIKVVQEAFQQIGQMIQAQVAPVMKQLGDTLQTQLLPAWKQLEPELKQLAPLFQLIAGIIGGLLLVQLGLLISVIAGVAKGFAMLLPGVIQAFGGIVQIISGALQIVISVVTGVFNILRDIFTGNWSAIGNDTRNMVQGIANGVGSIINGMVNLVVGLFRGLVGGVVGLVSGFVSTIISFFENLAGVIVGHSIIPDMVNAILQWFRNLLSSATSIFSAITGAITTAVNAVRSVVTSVWNGIQSFLQGAWSNIESSAQSAWNNFVGIIKNATGAVTNAVQNIASNMISTVQNMGGQLAKAGSSVVNDLAGGIRSAAGNVASAAANVAGNIKKFLGFGSPTEEGPGSTADLWMPNFINMLVEGLNGGQSKLQGAAQTLAQSLAQSMNVGTLGNQITGSPLSAAAAGAANQPLSLAAANPTVVVAPMATGTNGPTINNHFHASMDQALAKRVVREQQWQTLLHGRS